MKRFFISTQALPFWILLGTVLALAFVEQYQLSVWVAVKPYFFSSPFFYQSLAIYSLSLALALFTYRNLYNLKVLLAGFLFFMTGLFCLHYFFHFSQSMSQFFQIQNNEKIHLLFYLFYSLDLLLIALVPSTLPKSLARFMLSFLVVGKALIVYSGPRYLVPAVDVHLPWFWAHSLYILLGLNVLIVALAHILSFRRRDVYGWPITGFLVLFTIAFIAKGSDLEQILLFVVPVFLSLMVLANLTLSLSHRANYDPLLNIYNRGHCNNILQGKVRPLSKRFALALFDLDHFKRLNDRYGHQAGDTVLYYVAQKIREKALPKGIACRYGGEELIVIFPDASREYVTKTAREIVSSVAQMRIPVAGKKKNNKLRVTVSAGLAMTKPNKSIPAVVAMADKALYRSKRQGRNRLTIAR